MWSHICLRQLCQSFTKTSSSSYFQKNDRAILSELNSKHEIVRLLSNSLSKCRQWDIEASVKSGVSTQADSIIDDRYSHEEYINEHLALMKFFLKEGNLYLSKGRAKEVWENPSRCVARTGQQHDRHHRDRQESDCATSYVHH